MESLEKASESRGRQSIQTDLERVGEQLAAIPNDTREAYSLRNLVNAVSAESNNPVDQSQSSEEEEGFKEYNSLLERRRALKKERLKHYEENPQELPVRLQELYKRHLQNYLTENPERKELLLQTAGSEQKLREFFIRPQGESEQVREYDELLKGYNDWVDKQSDPAAAAEVLTPHIEEANRQVYESLRMSVDKPQAVSTFETMVPQSAEFVTNHILEKDLAYQDAELPEEHKKQMLNWSHSSGSAKQYAESIASASAAGGLEGVRTLARQIRDTMLSEAARLQIPVSPHGKSVSWAMWDIGKQYHFFTHENENDPKYAIGNPLESETKREEIINRHLGWEAYAAFKGDAAYHKSTMSAPSSIRELLNKSPKANGTLSSQDLAELGRLLRAR